jgi:hypothetical protein
MIPKTHTETTRVLHYKGRHYNSDDPVKGIVGIPDGYNPKTKADLLRIFIGLKSLKSARIETITRVVRETRTSKEIRK